MTYPAFDTSHLAETDATPSGLVTCTSCGCRLDPIVDDGALSWYHFSPMSGRDARGCVVACADTAHDGRGRARA